MKKQLILNRFLILIGVFCVIAFSTCKKDENASLNITGTWQAKRFGTNNVVNQYQFKSDGSVEFIAFQIDTLSMNTIGYQNKLTGMYSLNKNTLTFTGLKYLINLNFVFGPVTDLNPITGPAASTYTIALNNQRTQLSVYFDCPINAICTPSPLVYLKQ